MSINRRQTFALAAAAAVSAFAAVAIPSYSVMAFTQPEIGKLAPNFTAVDSTGKARSLSEFKGKVVVLEWTNHDCPYVRKHYGSANMQGLQRDYTAKGVVWLSIISSAPGEQGFVSGSEADQLTRQRNAAPTAVLLDPKGDVGKLYAARTTPHMYVINASGNLVYAGGIDDRATANPADIASSKNFVRAALDEVLAGKPVTTTTSRAYGCSVKYAS